MTAVEHKSDFELIKDPLSHASYGVLLCGSGVNYIVISPSHCIWIFLKYNSLRSNDASASYVIIVETMASHLLGTRPLSKPIVPWTYWQFDTWNKRGGVSTPYPRGSTPLPSPKIQIFLPLKKNRPLLLAKGVWKCRQRNVGSLGSASVSD